MKGPVPPPTHPTYVHTRRTLVQFLFEFAWYQSNTAKACASWRGRPNLIDLIDHTKTFIVTPCRTLRFPHGLTLGAPSQHLWHTTHQAGRDVQVLFPFKGLEGGRRAGGQILDPSSSVHYLNLVGVHICDLAGKARWLGW